MHFHRQTWIILWLTWVGCLTAAADYLPSSKPPPAPLREFRGVWVASVSNIDWPSKPGLTTAEQKAELAALMDRAGQLKLNAIVLQVRPACDALYESKLEPWSEYLTGRMGVAPAPFYDPLEFAVAQAHLRGLELHAWFNPYRARQAGAKSPASAGHISNKRPQLVRQYGKHLWLDPGEKAVQDHSLAVIMDVVRRYDIDGVHLDDYFYPYPEKDDQGNTVKFPDGTPWRKYLASGGKLSREDWRRENVNNFVHHLYNSIKSEKPWVKFGISPFGIWRPGNPPQVKGKDAYEEIFADSKKWLTSGWVDYFSPQLYWSIDAPEQSYPALLKWWAEQNSRQRHLWPGLALSKPNAPRLAKETANQITLTRNQPGATGNLLWSAKPLLQNREGIGDQLRSGTYTTPALVPASPWLSSKTPGKPALTATDSNSTQGTKLVWSAAPGTKVRFWVLQVLQGGKWTTDMAPAGQTSGMVNSFPEAIAVRAQDFYGNLSAPAVLERAKATGK